jgi:hypothetical protein
MKTSKARSVVVLIVWLLVLAPLLRAREGAGVFASALLSTEITGVDRENPQGKRVTGVRAEDEAASTRRPTSDCRPRR